MPCIHQLFEQMVVAVDHRAQQEIQLRHPIGDDATFDGGILLRL